MSVFDVVTGTERATARNGQLQAMIESMRAQMSLLVTTSVDALVREKEILGRYCNKANGSRGALSPFVSIFVDFSAVNLCVPFLLLRIFCLIHGVYIAGRGAASRIAAAARVVADG